MESEYHKALDRVRNATKVFSEAQRRYRAGEIGDTEFLAARTTHREESAIFDRAYELASKANEIGK